MSDYEFTTKDDNYNDYIGLQLPYLELMLSNKVGCGFRKGTVIRFKGEPSSGKSMVSMHILASCANDPRTEGYSLVYIDNENGISGLDIKARFSKEAAERVHYIQSEDAPNTIEGMHKFIRDTCSNTPSIIVVDSMDTLLSDKELELAKEADKLRSEGKPVPEPPMMLGPRASSAEWKKTNPVIAGSGSVVMLISQTRKTPSVYAGAFNSSGGQALEFYSSIVLGVKAGEQIKRTDRWGKERVVGSKTQLIPKKNRQTAIINESAVCSLYYSLGFISAEDVFDFLTERTQCIKKGGGGYYACDWLFDEEKKMRKNDWIKTFINNKECYNKALNRMESEWNLISKDFSDIF